MKTLLTLFVALSVLLVVDRTPRQQYGRSQNVEAYVKAASVEVETLGPPTPLKPKESVTHEESWEVRPGEHFLTLETVHRISEQLSR